MTLHPPAAPPDSKLKPALLGDHVTGWANRAIDNPAIHRQRDRWLTAGMFVMSLAVYFRTLIPGVGYSGDVAKWQYMSETGGVPHASGYPLWVALIQAWGEIVPWGTPASRTSLLSAVIGAAAVAVLFRLLRVLNIRRTVAASAALTFALTPTFWAQSSVAEVYSLHILFMGLITLCLARWRLGASNRWLLAAMAVFALSLGHHMMTVLALPGMAWVVWSDRRRALTWRNAVYVATFAVVGACQYFYLIYMTKTGGFVEEPVHNLADIWELVRGGQFESNMWAFSLFEYLEDRLPLLGEMVGTEYLVLQAPIAYGIWRGLRAERPYRDISIHLLALGFMSTMFATNYDVFDVEVFFLPLLFVLAVFLGWGLEGAIHWAGRTYPGHQRLGWAVTLGLVALPLIVGVVDYRRASQRGNISDRDRIETAIAQVGSDAVFVTDNYSDNQFFTYYLMIDGLTRQRRLTVAGDPDRLITAKAVARYLETGDGPVAAFIRKAGLSGPLPVYTANRAQARRLEGDGLALTRLDSYLWRVERPS